MKNNRLYRLTMLKTHKHTATAQNSPVKEICAHTEMMQIQKHIHLCCTVIYSWCACCHINCKSLCNVYVPLSRNTQSCCVFSSAVIF